MLWVFLQCIFFFACTWSIGASVNDEGRVHFDKLLRELISVSKNGVILNYLVSMIYLLFSLMNLIFKI